MRHVFPSDRFRPVEVLVVGAIAVALMVRICWVVSYFAGARISLFLTSMNPTVGFCFDGAAMALWLTREERPRAGARRIALSLSWIVLTIGLSKLADLMLGTAFCPDTLLIPERLKAAALYPGQMSSSIAACFCVLGLALLSLRGPLDGAIGIALFPGDGTDRDGLVRAADDAMYRAKAAGRISGRLLNVEMAGEVRGAASSA